MDKSALEILLGTLDNWAAFFTLLVVVGVGGELVVHIMASRASARLIAIQHHEEQQFKTEVARLHRESSEANARAAEANEAAERERLARTELEKRIAPRRLSGAQKSEMVRLLSTDSGHAILVVSRLMDSEGADLANDFLAVLRDAHWAAELTTMYTGNEEGISVATVGGTDLPGLRTLETTLKSIGIAHNRLARKPDDKTIPPGFQPTVIYLLVGHK